MFENNQIYQSIMNLLKSITLILAIVLFSNCKFEKETKDTSITKSELVGNWKLSEALETENDIQNLTFNADFTAEITFNEGSSTKIIQGTWQLNKPLKIGTENLNVTLKSDVLLHFNDNENEYKSNNHTIMLDAQELNNHKILATHNMLFSKI